MFEQSGKRISLTKLITVLFSHFLMDILKFDIFIHRHTSMPLPSLTCHLPTDGSVNSMLFHNLSLPPSPHWAIDNFLFPGKGISYKRSA